MELEKVDLNLLVVFNELLKTGNVSQAAENLHVSQPTISSALNRLRTVLDDELFQRTSKGMQPTAYAQELAGPVTSALDTLRQALSQKVDFDAAQAACTFTLATTDFGEAYLLPRLLTRLRAQAPNVMLQSVRYTPQSLKEQMESGRVDVAVGLLPHLEAGYFQRRLFEHDYVCLYRRDHPVFGVQPMTLQAYLQAQHIAIESPDPGHGKLEELLQKQQVRRQAQVRVSHFGSIPYLLLSSDLIATVPRIFALAHAAQFGLAFCALPVDLPPFCVNVFWHARYHKAPAHQWLRAQLFSLPDPAPPLV